MTVNGWLQIGLYALVILALTKPFGIYLHRVFEDERPPFPRTLGRLERLLGPVLEHVAALAGKVF